MKVNRIELTRLARARFDDADIEMANERQMSSAA